MKYLILSHQSALLTYRYFRKNGMNISYYKRFSKKCLNSITKDVIKFTNLPIIFDRNNLLHLTIFGKNNYRKIQNALVHYYKNTVPVNSFCIANNEVLIPSPEFLFCQMASTLGFVELVLLGFEFCGTYTLTNTDNSATLITDCRPLTNQKKLSTYVNLLSLKYKHFPGINKAREALSIVADMSSSPQESRLYFMLAAAHKYGGYAVKNLKLNQDVYLSKKAETIAGQKFIVPDISNYKTKLSIEYDSAMYHENYRQNTRDKRRLDAMQHDGWKVFSFVKEQVNDINVFHPMAVDILKTNGQRPRIRIKDYFERRDRLHSQLFSYKDYF